jgi:hypothetical protein
MVTYGADHCAALGDNARSFDERLADTYYDAQRVYYQIADYTGDAKWNRCAEAAERIYRDGYVLPNNGGIPGYWIFSMGLRMSAERTGAAPSRNAVSLLATNAAYAPDATPLPPGESSSLIRELAYVLNTYLDDEELGAPVRDRRAVVVDRLLQGLGEWTSGRSGVAVKPFMIGLAAEALIRYEGRSGDSRVKPTLLTAADWLWEEMWVPQAGAFLYATKADESGTRTPAPDLNLLIAPLYGWAYQTTGNPDYRTRGDAVFTGGVQQSYLKSAKIFHQNYRWSFEYVRGR